MDTPLPPSDPAAWSERERRLLDRDASLDPSRFSTRVLKLVYEFALTRNAWGTTNIDSEPIAYPRVEELRDAQRRQAQHLIQVKPSEREVLNYFTLLQDLPRIPWSVTSGQILHLHQKYFRDVPLENRAKPGAWKTRKNYILGPGNHRSSTSSPEEVSAHIDALADWWNNLRDPRPEDVARFFHSFQCIHPFADGNGRIGRLLSLHLLSSIGFTNIHLCPIDDTLNEERTEYLRLLFQADMGRDTHWIAFFLSALEDGYRRATRLAQRLQSIPHDLPASCQQVLEWAYAHQIHTFTTHEVSRFFEDLSERTRTRHLARLVERGMLQAEGTTKARKYRVVLKPFESLSSAAP